MHEEYYTKFGQPQAADHDGRATSDDSRQMMARLSSVVWVSQLDATFTFVALFLQRGGADFARAVHSIGGLRVQRQRVFNNFMSSSCTCIAKK